MAKIVGALPSGTKLKGQAYTYIIDSVLGQGTFGITYLASTMMPGPLGEIEVQVAIKEFFGKDFNYRTPDGSVSAATSSDLSAKYLKAFHRESSNLSKLKNRGVVNVLEAFEANGTAYYSMEYLSGKSLDEKVAGSGIPEEEALPLIREIGSALQYMHDNKMMHLDLKPRNIMLRKDGSPVIIDFGLSKQYDESGNPESSSGIGLGTPGYAPLEQSEQSMKGVFNPCFDIYALGATLFKMLVGRSPVNASEILIKGFPREELEEKGVSSRTIAAIQSAMSPKPQDRPQSVGEFLNMLTGESVSEETELVSGMADSGLGAAAVKPKTVHDPSPESGAKPRPPKPGPVPKRPLSPETTPSQKRPRKALLMGLVGGLALLILLLGGYAIFKKPSTPKEGFLSLTSTPAGALVYVDGKDMGSKTPVVLSKVPVGNHTVSFRLEGYEEKKTEVMVLRGDTARVVVAFVAVRQPTTNAAEGSTAQKAAIEKRGSIKVTSTPAGADIYLDGKKTGKTTPEILEDIVEGTHTLQVRLDGYVNETSNVTVKSDARSEKAFALSREAVQPGSNASTPSSQWSETRSGSRTTFSDGKVSFTMVSVAGGTFTMGATPEQEDDAYDWEKPAHKVTLDGFSIGETEVTQALWTAVMGSNPSSHKGDSYPVERVSWNDCRTFISKLNSLTGKSFRLPTEAEWEFAARGGNLSRGYKYSGSNDSNSVAWYDGNSGNQTHAVKTKSPNELGLYDMSGNVYEWCSDWYGAYSSSPQTNPRGPASGSNRVIRGGGSFDVARFCRVSNRISNVPTLRNYDLGLRLAL